MELLTKRYEDKILGVLNCYDRLLLKGTLPTIIYTPLATNSFSNTYMVYTALLRLRAG